MSYFQRVPTGQHGAIHYGGESFVLDPDRATELLGILSHLDDFQTVAGLEAEIEEMSCEIESLEFKIDGLMKKISTLEAENALLKQRLQEADHAAIG